MCFHAGSPLRPFFHMHLTFRFALPFLNNFHLMIRLFVSAVITENFDPWQVLFLMYDFL